MRTTERGGKGRAVLLEPFWYSRDHPPSGRRTGAGGELNLPPEVRVSLGGGDLDDGEARRSWIAHRRASCLTCITAASPKWGLARSRLRGFWSGFVLTGASPASCSKRPDVAV